MTRLLPLVAVVPLAACGGGKSHPADASVDAYPTADHAAYPQVPDQGGPTLQHPQLVSVTFAGDSRVATLEGFAQWIVTSQWLAAAGTEYGIGQGAVAGVAHRTDTPPTTITSGEIEAYLAAGVADGSIPRPSSLSDALYIIYYPATTSITATFVNGIMKQSCIDFGGYHGEVHQMGLDFAYAAIPDCAGAAPGLTADETTELVVSHEVIEAATDAMPISAPAWQLRADPSDAWYTAFQFEVEVGDLCEDPTLYVREAGYVAQRIYSNGAAAAGEPCVPGAPTPAFGATAMPLGVQTIARGSSMDFTLTGWSSGPVDDWKVASVAWLDPGTATSRPHLTLSAATVNNGGTVTAHVAVPSSAGAGETAAFLVESSHSDADASIWPIAIVVQ
jgi:hypothetical protein